MACIDFSEGPVSRVTPVVETTTPVKRERLLFSANTFGCGGCADNRRLQSALSICRAFWYASRAKGKCNVETPRTPSEKATYSSCLPQSGPCVFRPHGAVNLLEIAIPD